MLNFVLRKSALVLSKIILGIEASGRENIPKRGGFILASNHLSHLDPVVVAAVCPRRLSFMARDSLFKNPAFGWLISSAGAFPVKRSSADLSALKEALKCLKKNCALLLFPEGTRAVEPEIERPAQPGIGFLAVKSGVPVIPAFVKGTDKALPCGSKVIKFHKVSIRFGKPVEIDRLMPYADIAQQIMQAIRQVGQNPL